MSEHKYIGLTNRDPNVVNFLQSSVELFTSRKDVLSFIEANIDSKDTKIKIFNMLVKGQTYTTKNGGDFLLWAYKEGPELPITVNKNRLSLCSDFIIFIRADDKKDSDILIGQYDSLYEASPELVKLKVDTPIGINNGIGFIVSKKRMFNLEVVKFLNKDPYDKRFTYILINFKGRIPEPSIITGKELATMQDNGEVTATDFGNTMLSLFDLKMKRSENIEKGYTELIWDEVVITKGKLFPNKSKLLFTMNVGDNDSTYNYMQVEAPLIYFSLTEDNKIKFILTDKLELKFDDMSLIYNEMNSK